jgi:hypothetical protein
MKHENRGEANIGFEGREGERVVLPVKHHFLVDAAKGALENARKDEEVLAVKGGSTQALIAAFMACQPKEGRTVQKPQRRMRKSSDQLE